MGQVVENNVEFSGAKESQMVVVVTGSATLQAKAANGTWVNVPDGALTDTVQCIVAPFDAIFRFTSVTGTVVVYG